jgi:hypothetical protein
VNYFPPCAPKQVSGLIVALYLPPPLVLAAGTPAMAGPLSAKACGGGAPDSLSSSWATNPDRAGPSSWANWKPAQVQQYPRGIF